MQRIVVPVVSNVSLASGLIGREEEEEEGRWKEEIVVVSATRLFCGVFGFMRLGRSIISF